MSFDNCRAPERRATADYLVVQGQRPAAESARRKSSSAQRSSRSGASSAHRQMRLRAYSHSIQHSKRRSHPMQQEHGDTYDKRSAAELRVAGSSYQDLRRSRAEDTESSFRFQAESNRRN